jgi:hypothetical protein
MRCEKFSLTTVNDATATLPQRLKPVLGAFYHFSKPAAYSLKARTRRLEPVMNDDGLVTPELVREVPSRKTLSRHHRQLRAFPCGALLKAFG